MFIDYTNKANPLSMHALYAESFCNAILKGTTAFCKYAHFVMNLVNVRPVSNKGKQSLSSALSVTPSGPDTSLHS